MSDLLKDEDIWGAAGGGDNTLSDADIWGQQMPTPASGPGLLSDTDIWGDGAPAAAPAPAPVTNRKIIKGREYRLGEDTGAVFDDKGKIVNDPSILQAFGKGDPGIGDYATELGHATVRGVASTARSTGRGLNVLTSDTQSQIDRVEQGIANLDKMSLPEAQQLYDTLPQTLSPAVAFNYQVAIRKILKGDKAGAQSYLDAARKYTDTRPIEEQGLSVAGKQLEDATNAAFPQDPRFKGSITSDVGQAGGSSLFFLPIGLLTGGTGVAFAGAAAGADQSYQQAKDDIATSTREDRAGLYNAGLGTAAEQKALEAGRLGALPGASEVVPTEVFLEQMPKFIPGLRTIANTPVWGRFAKAFGRIGTQVLSEGGQEAFQQWASNVINKLKVNPEQDVTEDVLYNALLGGIVGGGMQTGVEGYNAVFGKDEEAPQPQPQPQPNPQTVNQAGKGDRIEPRLFPDMAAPVPPGSGPTEPPPPPISDDAYLMGAGYTAEQISDMNPDERASAAEEARAQGVEPVDFTAGAPAPGTAPMAPRAPAGPAEAPSDLPEEINMAPAPGTAPMAPRGTRKDKVNVQSEQDLEAVRPTVNAEPTPAQAAAGNYQKGHIRIHGMDVSIENPRGSVRRSKDENDPWQSPELPADYGYIKGTTGKDGDHVDVYIGPNPQSDRVYVIDQHDLKSGKFDEHKSVLGADSLGQAVELYTQSFDNPTLDRIGDVTEMSVDEFRQWVKDGKNTRRPAAYAGMGTVTPNTPSNPPAKVNTPPAEDFDSIFQQELDQEYGAKPQPEERGPAVDTAAIDAAFTKYLAGRRPLNAETFAADAGIDTAEAGRAMQRAHMAGRIMPSRNGGYRRLPTRSTPINVLDFIASIGGISDPTGELAGMDLPKMGPFGPPVRKNGLHPDKVREALIERGYLRDPGYGTDRQQQTTVNDVYDLIARHMGGQKVYSVEDQAKADDIEATRRADALTPADWEKVHPIAQRWGEDVWNQIQQALADMGLDEDAWSPQEVNDAARMVAGGMDAGDAFERAALAHIDELDQIPEVAPEIAAAFEKNRANAMVAMNVPPFPDVEPQTNAVQQQGSPEAGDGLRQDGARREEPAGEAEVPRPAAEVRGPREAGGEAGIQEPAADEELIPAEEALRQARVRDWEDFKAKYSDKVEREELPDPRRPLAVPWAAIDTLQLENGKFVAAHSVNFPEAGQNSGVSWWPPYYDTKEEAQNAAAQKVIAFASKRNGKQAQIVRQWAEKYQVPALAPPKTDTRDHSLDEPFDDNNPVKQVKEKAGSAKFSINVIEVSPGKFTTSHNYDLQGQSGGTSPATGGERWIKDTPEEAIAQAASSMLRHFEYDFRNPDLPDTKKRDVKKIILKLKELGGKSEGGLEPPAPAAEKGADNKEQLVIPGAEQDKKGALQNAAKAHLKASAPQKGMDVGLFGSERDQTDMFDKPAPKKAEAKSDDTTARAEKIREKFVIFSSGMSRLKDFVSGAYTTGGLKTRGIGIDVQETNDVSVKAMAEKIVQWQTRVFIDSGAFGIFKRNLKERQKYEAAVSDLFQKEGATPPVLKEISAAQLLKRYDAIDKALMEVAEREGEEPFPQPLYVAPDIVGDQRGSIDLVQSHGNWIKNQLDRGREIIIPIQKGEQSLAEAYEEIAQILGRRDFVVGVPSNQKAVTDAEFAEFVAAAKPPKLHFLGTTDPAKIEPRIQAIAAAGYEPDHVSSDANMLRALLYGRSDLEETRDQAIRRVIKERSPEFDELAGGKADDDFASVFEEELDAAFEEKPKKADLRGNWWEPLMGGEEKPAKKPKTAGQAAKSAAKNAAMGMGEIVQGLEALFGSKNKLSSGFTFDEESYAKALPFFKAAVAHLGEAVKDMREVVRALIRKFRENGMSREAIENMAPYLKRFSDDLTSGSISLEEQAPATTETSESPFHPLVQAFVDYLSQPDAAFDTITEARKFAAERGFDAKPGTPAAKDLDEKLELAIVLTARTLVGASKNRPVKTAYRRLVDLYNRQPNLGVRTSESMADQAYSTPAPLAYIASRLAGVAGAKSVLEPTAGNGMLLIEANPKKADVNELNDRRFAALKAQGFNPTQKDAATDKLRHAGYPVEAVIENPPFGAVKEADGSSREFDVDGWKTTQIDHAIALNTLKSMADNGRAVLIVGSVKEGTDKSRSDSYNTKQKREFYWRLYQGYNVTDHFTVSGDLYKRQGAGWPVDVIVIEGRAKSARPLPAVELPKVYDTWESLEEKLDEAPVKSQAGTGQDVGRGQVSQPADVGHVAEDGKRLEGGSRRDQSPDGGRGAAAAQPAADGQGAVSERRDQRELDGAREQQPSESDGREMAPGERSERDGGGKSPVPVRERLKQDAEAAQQPYKPMSSQPSLDTKIPTNMAAAVETSLQDLADRHGGLDTWLETELGYKKGEIGKYLAAEQVDAVALALDNVQKNAAFIIGDQTGIGKGRVVASALRYAMRKGLVPIFVTEKPNLYGDIIRDLTDIGVPQMLGRDLKPFLTNSGESIPLDDEAVAWYDEAQTAKAEGRPQPAKRGKFLRASGGDLHKRQMAALQKDGTGKDFDIIFTTYDQLNTVKGQTTDRRRLVEGLADRAFVVLDESHNAGGTEASERGSKNAPESRSDFLKKVTSKAKAVMFSSATYAKRPGVMALYARTDMGKAVEKPEMLGELISRGGVPMQQVVAAMLAKAGQYIRRERSFDGVSYDVEPVKVDLKAYEAVSTSLAAIARFDIDLKRSETMKEIRENLKENAEALGMDSGAGEVSISSTNFTSLMHNIVNQMLLAIKVDAVASRAIEALQAGEKPVITVANTMGAFLKTYAEDNDLKRGDPVGLSFRDVLDRYLERTRRLTIKRPDGTTYHYMIPLSALPGDMQRAYKEAGRLITEIDTTNLPISPIDWLRFRLSQAGYRVSEITGRKEILDYAGPDNATFSERLDSEVSPAGRRVNIDKFNRGDLDVMILNRAGSTGLSLHASSKFKDQRRRRMIIAQAELNIDVHMQMLGRVHRTGQVIPPAFVQAYADVPAEARPAAVLAKKMASLNANTTASRKSAFSADDSVDFLNDYGDQVAREYLKENPEINFLLEVSLDPEKETARELTGRLLLLPVADQKRALDEITARYKVLIENLDAMGENALEAKTMDLEAKTVGRQELKPAEGDSPFTQAVILEETEVKSQGKALPLGEILQKAAESLGTKLSTDDPVKALGELYRTATAARPAFAKKWIEDFDRMAADELKVTKNEDLKAKRREAHMANKDRFNAILDIVLPGGRVEVKAKDGASMIGIVMNVSRRGQTGVTGNPLALGAWSAEIAIPDNAQRIMVPFSSMALPGDTVGESERKVFVNAPDWAADYPNTVKAFEDARKTGKETRYIVTGNILAGFDQTKGQGQIVNYTDDQGNVKPGILMSKTFSPKAFLDERAVRFKTAAQVMTFLKQLPAAEIVSHDEIIAVRRADSWTEIEMPAARQSGGTYFLNPDVRKAAYDQFTKVGSRMRYRTNLDESATRVLDAMMKAGAVFQTTDQQEVAEEIIHGKKPGGPKQAPLSSRARGLTQTEAFKRWFGNSRVVDGSGRPLVVYHGTWATFDTFDPSRIGGGEGGFWFTTNETYAEDYGDVMEVYLNIQNPYQVTFEEWQSEPLSVSEIRAQGYDGIEITDFNSGNEEDTIDSSMGTAYLVFEPTQIKSATGNNGQFDPNKQSILSSKAKPVFYSGLLRAVEGMKQDKAPKAQWMGMIRNAPGVKPEEIAWIGLESWLAEQSGLVTKAQIADFVRANQVDVQEVVKERKTVSSYRSSNDYANQLWELSDEALGDAYAMEFGFDVDDSRQQAIDDRDTVIDELVNAYEQTLGGRGADDRGETTFDTTKYRSYQLPGGENYRELLLTLPEKSGEQKFSGYVETVNDSAADDILLAMQDENLEHLDYGRTEDAHRKIRIEFKDFSPSEWEKVRQIVAKVGERLNQTIPGPRGWNNTGDGTAAGDVNYRSGHWEETNILAHVRFNERRDAEGKRVLFIEEVQSDWHQTGRKKGYWGLSAEEKARKERLDQTPTKEWSPEDLDWYNTAVNDRKRNGVPDAPFKTSWPEFAMKRMIRWAAENGFDRIAWTPGEVQAERYDLSKQINSLSWYYQGGLVTLEVEDPKGRIFNYNEMDPEKGLDELIGKEMGDKIRAAINAGKRKDSYTGLDLRVGGEGMKGFYNKILVDVANKLGKKWGAKVGTTVINIEGGKPTQYADFSAWERAVKGFGNTVPSLDITPAMQAAAMEGQPLFKRREQSKVQQEPRKNPYRFVISQKQTARLIADLEQIAERILGHSIARVQVVTNQQEWNEAFGEAEDAVFDPNTGIIYIALHGTLDPRSTIRHEAIHALRQAGVITGQEWAVLSRMARTRWIEQYKIRGRYEELYRERFDITEAELEELLIEEAIADAMAAHWVKAPAEDVVSRIFARVKAFLEALGNALRGQGFTTVSQILEGAERGAMSRRRPGTGQGRDFLLYARQGEQALLSSRRQLRPPRSPAPGSFEAPHDERVRRALFDSTDTLLNRIKRAGSAFGIAGRRKLQDREVDLLRTQAAIEQASGPLSEPKNAYLAASLYPGRVAQRDKDLVEDVVEPLIEDIARRGLSLEQVNDFVMARHAIERNLEVGQLHKPGTQFHEAMTNPAVVGASGMSENEAVAVLQAAVNAGKYADLEAIGDKIVDMNRRTLAKLYAEGLITQEQYDALTAKYQYYVPLRGWDDVTDDSHPESPRTGRRYDIRGREFQQAFGRTSKADSPLAYSIMQARQAIIRIEKNRVGKRFLRLAQAHPNESFWEVNRIDLKKIVDQNTGYVRNVFDRGAAEAENVYAVKVGGKRYNITLHHEGLLRAMKGIGGENMGDLVAFFHKINRFFAAVNTSYDPEFIFRNFLRDVQQAGIVMQEEKVKGLTRRILASIPKAAYGMNQMLAGNLSGQWARYAREFADAGGKIGFMDRGDVETEKRNLEKLMKQANAGWTGKTLMAANEFTLERLARWNDTIENTLRLATYVQLRMAGATKDRAAFVARELTVNFNRKGEWGPQINAFYLFFNASMQGAASLFMRVGRSRKMKVIVAGIIVEAILMDMLNRMIGGDDDDDKNRYDKIPFEEKARNHIFMMPKWVEDKYGVPYFKVPLPLGWNWFNVIGQQASQMASGVVGPLEAFGNIASTFADSFNPLGSGSFLNTTAPTILDPAVDIATNKDFFGEDIVPRTFDETTPYAERYRPNVNPAAKWLTDTLASLTGGSPERPGGIDWSPEWVEHLADFTFGGVGRFFTRSMSTAEAWLGDAPADKGKVPFQRVFVGRDSTFADRDEYFQIRDAVHITEKELKARMAEGDTEAANAVRSTYAREVKMIGLMDNAEKKLGKLRKQYKATKNALQMGEAVRKERLKAISSQMDDIQKLVRTRWHQLGKDVETGAGAGGN